MSALAVGTPVRVVVPIHDRVAAMAYLVFPPDAGVVSASMFDRHSREWLVQIDGDDTWLPRSWMRPARMAVE